ncbi:MAG: radical SAM protein [Candidatus Eremiobacteraeota bacterium]|nr:radical SAM protein [Candidatus Eremiobacteraeota bacterium]
MKDITLVNLNMLYVRHFDRVEREYHVPLGPLYLTAALEREGFSVDFRDYQFCQSSDPFSAEAIVDFVKEPSEILGFSVMANLLPFTLMALEKVKERYPDRTIILGGVGPKSVERAILERFPWIDLIAVGESERSAPALVRTLQQKGDLGRVPGILYRREGTIVENPRPPRIEDLDAILFPAFHHIDLSKYEGYGVLTSRGCPYGCTFCSVAPIWDRKSYSRSAENIVKEMRLVHEKAGADLFLFQDEFFVSSKKRVLEFCRVLKKSGLPLYWKTFGRVDLTDGETLREMARAGCLEVRYGIESGSAAILERTRKGFTPEEAVAVVSEALRHIPRVDTFYVWGFPFETMRDFYQSLFQMINFRTMGARVLPSLLCFLPQTDIYGEYRGDDRFTFCPDLFPEYMVTGHEVCRGARASVLPAHRAIFRFIEENRDLFPGFFHYALAENVNPKLALLQEFGFYLESEAPQAETDSCGAHSPKVNAQFKSDRPASSPAATATGSRRLV